MILQDKKYHSSELSKTDEETLLSKRKVFTYN